MQAVVVVGAGIVGLTAALSVAKAGWSLTLIEANPQPCQTLPGNTDPYDVKVVAINRASQQVFEKFGVWTSMRNCRLRAYQSMKVWDEVADGRITFSAQDYFSDDLGHIIEQQVIIGALWQALLEYPHVDVRCGDKVMQLESTSSEIQIHLQSGAQLKASLLIAADGANSSIRDLCQIDVKRWSYDQTAIVATIEGSLSHQSTAYQRFAKDGPLALLPLADRHLCSIVWTTTPTHAQWLCQLPESEFNTQLTRESGGVMGDLTVVSRRFQFPLHAQQAQLYTKERCVLVGDAAHTLHPLAGQGVNLGIADVACLFERLMQAHAKRRDIATLSGLLAYQRRRRLHNQMMIVAMDAFKRGFQSPHPIIRALRNTGLNWVNQQKHLKQIFARLAQGV